MSFVDELTIFIKAGDGGAGVERWRHEKGKEFGGPSGGDGGRGGSVYVVGSRDLGLLFNYRHKKDFKAENGTPGAKNSLHGKNGEDLVIPLPLGSVVTNLKTKNSVHVLTEGKKILLLSGGDGGFGNEHFKRATNQRPKKITPGYPGAEAKFYIELQLVVDVGFVGFPNAGKSSLLNALTNASAKVGSYQFTTLEPNLGALYGYILADIPGLIEGASEGKGLGHKFLRHIKRTKMIAHLISLENEDVADAYRTIRKELEQYDEKLVLTGVEGLTAKEEIIILTKTDLVDGETLKKAQKELSVLKNRLFSLSIYDDAALKDFSDALVKLLRKKISASQ
ncbi:MAG: hypothetical protein A2942_03620 [Candidatus Lloydbacteria bacterium RIFCSPLOWO2_01_FULL_50_20]|uniref:GTPase Obg n=1 Tax=Candidatus Lloydbacteria bacterium RIFCSPLOWO2_01_FULL_50_20 TaxID=1798665 RepID=A0A1G2DK02_9BACT|nr:MAG: hypothetical protein A2942_03620 [Candidatus Lloydbacteria bacterium RIFCSPLOWO2_01_FULL_50_20]